jgi:hypothetical protein
MLRTVANILLFVTDMEQAVTWYSTVLGDEPSILTDRTAAFNLEASANFILICSKRERLPHCVALVCDNLEATVAPWRELCGVIEAEFLGPSWPVRSVVLSDLWGNFLVVMECATPKV